MHGSDLPQASKRDIGQLCTSSTLTTYGPGQLIACGDLSARHAYVIRSGYCTLRRVQRRPMGIVTTRDRDAGSAHTQVHAGGGTAVSCEASASRRPSECVRTLCTT